MVENTHFLFCVEIYEVICLTAAQFIDLTEEKSVKEVMKISFGF